MLYSQFFVEEDRYVISASEIVEIIPFIPLKLVPLLPEYVAGLMNYHGSAVPVVDLHQLLVGSPCKKKLSTRIIVVKKVINSGVCITFGFLVEKATEMIVIDETSFKPQAMKNLESPTNGPVAVHQEYLIEKISIESVIARLDKRLFPENHMLSNEPA